jgi:plastocyanin
MRRPSGRLIAIAAIAIPLALVANPIQRPAHAQDVAVTIHNFAFTPVTMTVPIGTTVTWTNTDTAAHTATSDPGDAISWNSGSIASGQSFSFTFTQAGTFPYHCAIHPFMTATIIIQSAVTVSTTTTAPTVTATPAASATVAPTSASTATALATSIPLAASPLPSSQRMGTPSHTSQLAWQGYYDGHLDTYLSTDISNAALAQTMGIRYAPGLKHASASSVDPMYLVLGRAAARQVAVFGSEPGESDYSPLWRELDVRWKASAQPALLTSDDQILSLQKQGKLTVRNTGVIMNCPIVKVGKG